jgi:hypothetical protein
MPLYLRSCRAYRGMTDEGLQALDMVMTAERYDLIADATGTIIGMPLIALSHRQGGVVLRRAVSERQYDLHTSARSGQMTAPALVAPAVYVDNVCTC